MRVRNTCVAHPEDEPLIIVRQWQLEATGGHKAAAALLSFFEYWHNIKLEQSRKAKVANEVARRHDDEGHQDESVVQFHNEQELREGVMLYGRSTINEGVKLLEELGFVEVVPNPNPRYAFDKTRHFVFHPKAVNEWLKHRYDQPEIADRSAENGSPSTENSSPSTENSGPIPETSLETSSESPSDDGTREAETENGSSGGRKPPSPPERSGPKGEDFVDIFWSSLSVARASRGTPMDEQRPVPKKVQRDLQRDVDAELEAGRDPKRLKLAAMRMGLRWDEYRLDLAEAIGDVQDGKPCRIEDELGRTDHRSRANEGGSRNGTDKQYAAADDGDDLNWLFGQPLPSRGGA